MIDHLVSERLEDVTYDLETEQESVQSIEEEQAELENELTVERIFREVKRYTSSFYILTSYYGDGLLGYAAFPGGPAKEDGVVINYAAFGTTGTAAEPFDGGRTGTHQVVHWLGLRHIRGDNEGCLNSDFVDDTPNQAGPNYNCPTHPSTSCSDGGDMFMNYMDYVNDNCMMMFTAGQSARMNATLRGPRAPLLRSNALTPPEEAGGSKSPPSLMGGKRILPSYVFDRWVHSREEDTGDVEIYRPPSYSFPPSRGRKGFELRKNGEFVEIGIGPTDAPTGSVRRWEAPGGDRIEVYDEDERVYVLELVSSSADVLKVRRHD